jgi:GntR family transcriptional regulator, vanillate catabolism transcriptional regulator
MQTRHVVRLPAQRREMRRSGVTLESQTLRALLEMRDLLLRGAFKPGERLREVPLAARLDVSRTPLRLVLERLEHEGLLTARPKGGFVASAFTVRELHDAIDIRGALEGMAARYAAERLDSEAELSELRGCMLRIDRLLQRWRGMDSFGHYIRLNGQFHAGVLKLAKSPMLRRSMQRALALPFASPNSFVLTLAERKEGREILTTSQIHHRAILDAIANREVARAEAAAREHSRLARTSLEMALRHKRLQTRVPGAPLITFPEAVGQ